jgi:hypothetical protein
MSDQTEPEIPEGAAVLPLIPPELGVDPLLLAVLHCLVFLEGSEDTIVDPEAAEEALDRLATYLQRVTGPPLQKVQEDLVSLAGYARQQGWPRQQARFFKEFLKQYGIAEGDEAE